MINTLGVLVMIGVVMAGGYLFSKLTNSDDNIVEEAAETLAERRLEELLDLEVGKLKGQIDLTPVSPEDRAV